MHLKEDFQAEGMSFLQQCRTLLHTQAGGDEEHGGGTTEGCLVELELVDDEVLVEDGDGHARQTCLADEVIVTAEIGFVSEDAEGGSAVLLVAEGDEVGAPLLLDPTLGGRFTLELGNDTAFALQQGLAQRGLLGSHLGHFLALVGNDFL